MDVTGTADPASQVRSEQLQAHLAVLARGVRISGSPDEAEAFGYLERELGRLGFELTRHRIDALISYPEAASVEVEAPTGFSVASTGHAMTPSTPPDGVVGDLVFVASGTAAEGRLDGKIVLSYGTEPINGNGTPAAYIRIDEEHLHERAISPIWGSPTPANLHLLPTVPSVGVRRADGERLRALLADGPVRVRVRSKTYRDWRPIPLLIADLPGQVEEDFVLFSAHVDSWHEGAMDNASANAVQLGVAEVLAPLRNRLRRGLRLGFWSGHSHGKFAGSTWYADTHWGELKEHCVCHVYIDSVGAVGCTSVVEAQTMAETFDYAAQVIGEVTEQTLERVPVQKGGDQSFWGAGVPSMFIMLSEKPHSEGGTVMPALPGAPVRQTGHPWFWHTPEDTIDKIDPEILLRDCRVYTQAIWGLCTLAELPFDYRRTAAELASALEGYQAAFGRHVDLAPLVESAAALGNELRAWYERPLAPADRNAAIKGLARALLPVTHTGAGSFDHDLGFPHRLLPRLAEGAALTTLPEETDGWRALLTQTLRERNRVAAALDEARRHLR